LPALNTFLGSSLNAEGNPLN